MKEATMQLRAAAQLSLLDPERTAALPLLGHTVSWRFSGIEIRHDEFAWRLLAADFAHAAPKPPTPRAALRRALIAWLGDRARAGAGPALGWDADELDDAGGGTAQRALIRVINRRGGDWLVFALVAEDIDLAALGLSYGTSLRFLLEKATGRLVCTADATGEADAVLESAQLEAEIQPYWRRYRAILVAADVSRAVRAIVAGLGAVSLRHGGGYYFVPDRRRDELARLRHLVADLPTRPGHEPFLLTLPQVDAPAARRQLARAAHVDFMAELGALDADLQRFLDAPEGTVRPRTIVGRLAAFRALRVKADAYAELLGMRQERIVGQLAGLVAKAGAVVLRGTDVEADDDDVPDGETPTSDALDARPAMPGLRLLPAPARDDGRPRHGHP